METNVIYGMYSGLALLMDVYRPARPNGYGIIHISGSGWNAPLSLDARPLKESSHVRIEGGPLVEAGYTVFTVNHRATPRFPYPAAVEDVQRAVRFIRYHAPEYGLNPDRIGAIGGSSGGHLVSMLGLLDGRGNPEDESPINRLSARVQCVVARAAPTNLLEAEASAVRVLFLGIPLGQEFAPGSPEYRRAAEASPITHITPDAPPFLLLHGEQDDIVPIAQSEQFATALAAAGVQVRLVRIPDAGHGPAAVQQPEIAAQIVAWFDTHLKP